MKAQALCFYLFTLLVLPLLASAVGGRGALVGGWQPIKNVNDPHVKEIGEFAVAEYNKSSKAALKFVGVVKGETQVVAGTNYRFDLEAKDGSVTKHYEAVVWEKPWENFRNLTSFKQIKDTHTRP
ncbi:cysteine proteinase inhibitor 1-like [Corylus avellana]|uniref:cysteine proteinase inhibitor 1-like n=1 Tax=Corylus avellana TaxID=13451 RepID=UPI001E23B630|nr:cysteine proteinase inhibitor 1-like [Corylus avellana]